MDIRIWARHLQMFNIYGSPIIYTGANPVSLKATTGTVPQTDWIDISGDVGNRDKIRLSFAIDRDLNGDTSTPGAFQPKKSVSNSLLIEGAAYQFIKDWVINHVAAPLNAVEIKIEDTSCGYYESYSIKNSQINWCENGICEFDVTLKQTDPQLQCIQKTLISDNWQGWFDPVPKNGKKHPRFSYCNETRPNAILIVQWYLLGFFADLSFSFYPIILVIAGAVNGAIFAINSIIFIINLINDILGTGHTDYIDPIRPPSFADMADYLKNLYVESAGCGREHPAPLIRDYIKNVCDKCGVQVDAITAPIFFAPTISIEASTRKLTNVTNPYYNACYLLAQLSRGIRRNKTNSYINGPVPNDDEFYTPDNAPLDSLDEFLDKQKTLFNAEWRLAGGKLYFWRKDWFVSPDYLFDFTENSEDRKKILEGVCFTWNEVKYPARGQGLYTLDPADGCGNEALSQMNGYVMFGNIEENPNFEGKLDKTTVHFGGTKFNLDGASGCYYYDAMQQISDNQILHPSSIPQMKAVDDWFQKYANYALLLGEENCTLGKVIIWDGESYLNAKAIRNVVPVRNSLVQSDPVPVVNPEYNALSYTSGNPDYEDWVTRHAPNTFVIGSALVPGGAEPGEYKVADYFGSLITHASARLVNYPMYFEPGYLDTLWDWFHWIDDPRRNPKLNASFEVKIELCCEDLEKLKVLDNGEEVRLGYKIKVPTPYYQDGVLMSIEINYDSSDELGKYITLKGNC